MARFVIAASPELVRAVDEVRSVLRTNPKSARPLYIRIGNAYVDDVVNGLVLDFIRESGGTSPRMRSLVETLAKLIKSVAHALVSQVFGKLEPERAAHVLDFIDDRLCDLGGKPGLGVPLDPDMLAGIESANAFAARGELSAHRAAFHGTMRSVIDRAIDGHYRAPFAMLDLGFILKKAVELGDDAIRSGAMRTIASAIEESDEATLAHLAKFLEVRVLR